MSPSGGHIEEWDVRLSVGGSTRLTKGRAKRFIELKRPPFKKGASTRPPFSCAHFLHLQLFVGWKAIAFPLLPRDHAFMPWPQMCHFSARGEKSKETKFLELCCKENNNSEKDWSHIFRLDTEKCQKGKHPSSLSFLTCWSFLFHWVLRDICSIHFSRDCSNLWLSLLELCSDYSVWSRFQVNLPDSS